MNLVERTCIAIRHTTRLTHARWLWTAARPIYNSAITAFGRRGLERLMNGTDSIRISPKFRNLGEVYEPELWKQFMSSLTAGDVVADVGAHIGLYTIALAKRLAPNGSVIAFEPHEQNYDALTHHVGLNGVQPAVETVRTAVGAVDGHVRFTDDQDVQNRIAAENTCHSSTVPAITLDSFFKDRRLDILKVDVEGFEEEVLRGGEVLLADSSRAPRLIYLEVHPYNWSLCGTSSDSLLGRLHAAHYEVGTLHGEQCGKIVTYGHIIARRLDKNLGVRERKV